MITVVNVRGLNTPDQRAGIAYVGRPFAGWAGHPLGNPHKGQYALALYDGWLRDHPDRDALLSALWEGCEHGAKPLGCWCVTRPWQVNVTDAHVCHAQLLAVRLLRLFGPRHLAFPGVPYGWRCPHHEPPADGTRVELLTRDGKVCPDITYRSPLKWLIRDFSPFQGHHVGWRPASPAPGESRPRRNH